MIYKRIKIKKRNYKSKKTKKNEQMVKDKILIKEICNEMKKMKRKGEKYFEAWPIKEKEITGKKALQTHEEKSESKKETNNN